MTKRDEIAGFLHCGQCLKEAHIGQEIETGITAHGEIVVWCRRHDRLVVSLELKDPPRLQCAHCDESAHEHRH
jgi:hypothetical protein